MNIEQTVTYDDSLYDAILYRAKNYEIRSYGKILVAETKINKNFEEAGNRAFRVLYDYINGHNKNNTKIKMVAPVTQFAFNEYNADYERTSKFDTNSLGGYIVQFKLPKELNLNNAPKPSDERIVIKEIPPRKMAVYSYTGSWSEKHFKEMLEDFEEQLEKDHVLTLGNPIFARFNSPFRLWFLRQNEIWFEVHEYLNR